MRKMMFLAAVASLTTLALSTGAAAQTSVPKDRRAMVRCPGDDASCVKLGLYQAMASTGSHGNAATANNGSANASIARRPASVHKSNPAGGVENNPASDSGAPMLMKMRKAAEKQAKLLAGNSLARSPSARFQRTDAVKNRMMHHGDNHPVHHPEGSTSSRRHSSSEHNASRMQGNRLDSRAPAVLRARETTRYRPTEF